MDRSFFANEIKTYIENSYKEFTLYQDIVKSIFNEFHRVCKKYDINYYLAFGSLLGVIRDDGMPPWDRDFDVVIPITEREKLIKALKDELSDEYYFMSDYTNNKYENFMIQVCKKGYNSSVIHVDVFYLIGAPDDIKKQEKMKFKIKKLLKCRRLKLMKLSEFLNNTFIVCVREAFFKFKLFFKPIKLLDNKFELLCKEYPYTESEMVIVVGNGTEVFPKTIFDSKNEISNNEFSCFVPFDSHRFLKIRYGDYNSYPPIEERFLEFYTGKRILDISGKR